MYQYNISFHDTMHTTKPTGTEIGNISNHLAETQMNYKELAHAVGEAGCSFCPAVYHGKRKAENFKSQQLIGLDFDNGVPFHIIQQKVYLMFRTRQTHMQMNFRRNMIQS